MHAFLHIVEGQCDTDERSSPSTAPTSPHTPYTNQTKCRTCWKHVESKQVQVAPEAVARRSKKLQKTGSEGRWVMFHVRFILALWNLCSCVGKVSGLCRDCVGTTRSAITLSRKEASARHFISTVLRSACTAWRLRRKSTPWRGSISNMSASKDGMCQRTTSPKRLWVATCKRCAVAIQKAPCWCTTHYSWVLAASVKGLLCLHSCAVPIH